VSLWLKVTTRLVVTRRSGNCKLVVASRKVTQVRLSHKLPNYNVVIGQLTHTVRQRITTD